MFRTGLRKNIIILMVIEFQSHIFNAIGSVPVAVSNIRTVRTVKDAFGQRYCCFLDIFTSVASFSSSNPLVHGTWCHGLVFQFRKQPTDVRVQDSLTPDPLPVLDRVFLITNIFIACCYDMREFMTDIMLAVCPYSKLFLDAGHSLQIIV